MTLYDEFNKIRRKQLPEESFLVPLLYWFSGDLSNIEIIQKINKKFFVVNRKVLISELSLNNVCDHFVKYPTTKKQDDTLTFFYNDVCHYFGWTLRELYSNLKLFNINNLAEFIAKHYGYDNKQRKLLCLEEFNYGQRKKTSNSFKKDTIDDRPNKGTLGYYNQRN
jgi:hypothetical protein